MDKAPLRLLRAAATKHIKPTEDNRSPPTINWSLIASIYHLSKERMPLHFVLHLLHYDYDLDAWTPSVSNMPQLFYEGKVQFQGHPDAVWRWLYNTSQIDWIHRR